ncbi:MAG TPA: hypothetical protein ENJ09_05990 [Planctomycetes bacterium]|nr:hypothetical protein [Planctomycetota bacterium]
MTPPPDPRPFAARLSAALDAPVELSFGRARRNVIVVRRFAAGIRIRVNAAFADAPEEVWDALAAWIRSGKRARAASARLDAFVAELAETLGPPKPRAVALRRAGTAHDLTPLARSLLADEFATELPGEFVERVTWGRRGSRRARRSLQLGSYDSTSNLVRVHPVLDQEAVPAFFVRFVLFHEFLHAAFDLSAPREHDGDDARRRRAHHPPHFRARERAYRDFERAEAWQHEHIGALLRSARTGRPLARPKGAARLLRAGQALLFPDR